jgi:glyoxylase-like metal-dependent hydrolase (beta-lactamase superfamily II)
LGGVQIQALHRGGGHTPGDTLLWLPAQRVVFAGDVVYVDRMLGMNPASLTKPWLATFAAMEALQPATVVPGHGQVTTLPHAQKDTKTLLLALRAHMGKAIEALQDMDQAIKSFDAAPFQYLQHAPVWLPQLANLTFLEMEKE